MRTILPCTYLGPVSYYEALLQSENPVIEMDEHYVKQTFRNRCQIATANKVMDLIVPVARPCEKVAMRDIKISYQQDWQKEHWNAIKSAYNMSPYFEYFAEDLEPFFRKQETFLTDLNLKLHEKVMELMQLKKEYTLTKTYECQPEDSIDLRMSFSPKKERKQCKDYYQVFSEKFGFQSDLSILDLLLNEGVESYKFLR